MGAFLDQRGMPSEVSSIRREHVEAFIEHLLANWSPATAAVRYRSLQQLFRWLLDEGEISVSPMARPLPEPTGVDYLGLVAAAHEAETVGPISFADVPLFEHGDDEGDGALRAAR